MFVTLSYRGVYVFQKNNGFQQDRNGHDSFERFLENVFIRSQHDLTRSKFIGSSTPVLFKRVNPIAHVTQKIKSKFTTRSSALYLCAIRGNTRRSISGEISTVKTREHRFARVAVDHAFGGPRFPSTPYETR